jgi:FAD/FMN-containing dehydrogenase
VEKFVLDGLRASFAERVLTAADPGYDDARASFNAIVTRRPTAIVRAGTVDEVIAAVVAAGDLGLPIAIRGGGHSVAGHSMADGALVVDLREMRSIEVDPVARVVRAGGGALWDDLDAAAWAHHLAVVGGTYGDTGIAGLTLGGGIGWLSSVQGFTCDTLIRAEVVTVAGERVVAGPDGDPELLWALRGGGGNFGVVTTFEYQAFDPGPITAGYLTYPGFAAKQVLRRMAETSATAPDALELTAWIGPVAERDGQVSVRVGVCWAGDPAGADDVLRPYRDALPIVGDTVGPMEYPDVQAMSGRLAFGLRHYWKGHFLRALDETVIGGIIEAVGALPGGQSGILLEAIRGVAHTEPEGGTAFAQRAATWNASAIGIWDDPAFDDAQVLWARAAADRIGVGSLTGAGYANYAPVDEPMERVRLAFGTERFERLSQIKARYDPGNKLRFNLNIGPALIRRPDG